MRSNNNDNTYHLQTQYQTQLQLNHQKMNRTNIIAFCVMMLGIACLAGSFFLLSSEMKQNDEVREFQCTVNQTAWSICSASTPGSEPCGIITLNATVCGDINAQTTMIVHANSYKEVQKKYPLGGSVDCWVDTNNCSIYTDYNKPSLIPGVLLLLFSLLLIGFASFLVCRCCCSRSVIEDRERVLN